MIKSHNYSVFNWGTVSLFSKVATLFYISSSSAWELQFLYILSSICYCHLLISLFLKKLGTIIIDCAKKIREETLAMCLVFMHAKSFQSCLTLCNPMNCSASGSSVQGILQARILEWVAMPSSRGSSPSRDRTCYSRAKYCRQILYLVSHFPGEGGM